MTLYLPANVPQAWAVYTRIEAHRGPNDSIRMLTGRTGHTALIYTSAPDGRDRLVGMLTPWDLEQIQALWKRRGDEEEP